MESVNVELPSELSSDLVHQLVSKAKHRSNSSSLALGKLTRQKILCFTFIFSPDHCNYFVTTLITLLIVALNFSVSHSMWTTPELCLCLLFLLAAFLNSFLVTATDPGVYPRLHPGEVDPLEDPNAKCVYCRICGVKRPPLTSHCYTCNVCVLRHDHHCSILGGCVGRRSLRYFVGYLVCTSSALLLGCMWAVRRVYFVLHATKQSRLAADSSSSSAQRQLDLIFIPTIFILIVNTVVLLLVGTFTVMYVYYFFTSITRRESQRGMGFLQTWRRLLKVELLCDNFYSSCFPPPSMLGTKISFRGEPV